MGRLTRMFFLGKLNAILKLRFSIKKFNFLSTKGNYSTCIKASGAYFNNQNDGHIRVATPLSVERPLW